MLFYLQRSFSFFFLKHLNCWLVILNSIQVFVTRYLFLAFDNAAFLGEETGRNGFH